MIETLQGSAHQFHFQMFLSSDHLTPALGKSVVVDISKSGGTFASPTPDACSESGNGWYHWTCSAADSDTLGRLIAYATCALCDADSDAVRVVARRASG